MINLFQDNCCINLICIIQPKMDTNQNESTMQQHTASTHFLEEIHEEAKNWSLEGDSKLLRFMQDISKNLETRCHSTKFKIDHMMLELNQTSLRLDNTMNKMLSLKNQQFMEARVHDETESSVNTVHNNNAKSVGPVTLLDEMSSHESIQKAVGKGLQMLEKCYEEVTLHLDDDSDDDIDEILKHSKIFKAKNPHNDRPLPHLIGSKEWTQQWHVGLADSDDDLSNGRKSPSSENDSLSSLDNDTVSKSISLPSNAPTASDSDYSFSQKTQSATNDAMESKYFKHDTPPLSVDLPPKPANRTVPINLFSETDQFENMLTQQNSSYQTPSIFRQQTAQVIIPSSGWASDEPPELTAPVSLSRKPVNLFMDTDDEDEDIKGVAPKSQFETTAQPTTSNISKPPNVLIPSAEPKTNAVSKPILSTKPPSIVRDLFDDSPPDDLFVDITANKPSVLKNRVSIFNDDEDDLASNYQIQNVKSVVDLPKSAKTNILPSNDHESAITLKKSDKDHLRTAVPDKAVYDKSKKTNIFDDLFGDDQPPDDDFADIFGTKRTNSNTFTDSSYNITKSVTDNAPVNGSVNTINSTSNSPHQSLTNLCDDDAESVVEPNGLFEKPKIDLSNRLKSKGLLFGEDSDEDSDWFLSDRKNRSKDLIENDVFEKSNRKQFIDIVETIPSEKAIESCYKDYNTNDTHTDNVRKLDLNIAEKHTSPALVQFANFFEQNTASDSKMVENRRVFVSYLDNEDPLLAEDQSNDNRKQNTHDEQSKMQNDNDEKPLLDSIQDVDTVVESVVASAIKQSSSSENSADKNLVNNIEVIRDIKTPTSAPMIGDQFAVNVHAVESTPVSEISSPYSQHSSNNIPIDTQHTLTNTATFFDDLPPVDDYYSAVIKQKTHTEESVDFFDDLPPEDDFQETTSTTTIADKSTTIFDDLPPEDDEFHTMARVNKPSSSAAVLFDDRPPDDDLFECPKQIDVRSPSKEIVSNPARTTNKALFYEDFADTIITKPYLAESSQISASSNLNDEVDRANPPPRLPITTAVKPKPNKLSSNLNINVAALLPGSKRPPTHQTDSSIVVTVIDEPTHVKEIPSGSLSKSTKTDTENSSRLVGLNKGRVKIAVVRRPSTREGRKQEYRKSLIAQHESSDSEDFAKNNATTSITSIAEMLTNPNDEDLLFKPLSQPNVQDALPIVGASKPNLKNEFDWLPTPDTSITFEKMKPKPIKELPKTAHSRPTTHLFSDDDDDDDLFASAKPSQKPHSVVVPNKSSPTVSMQQQSVMVNKSSKPPPIKGNLFGDDDSDDDLFGSTQQSIGKSRSIASELPKKNSLFEVDGDDEDNDLFGSSLKNVAYDTAKTTVSKVPTTKPVFGEDLADPLSDLLK